VEKESDDRASARRNLRIGFLHSQKPLRIVAAHPETDVAANRKRRREAEAPANAAKFTTTENESTAERRSWHIQVFDPRALFVAERFL
jgi:hypothetical protein